MIIITFNSEGLCSPQPPPQPPQQPPPQPPPQPPQPPSHYSSLKGQVHTSIHNKKKRSTHTVIVTSAATATAAPTAMMEANSHRLDSRTTHLHDRRTKSSEREHGEERMMGRSVRCTPIFFNIPGEETSLTPFSRQRCLPRNTTCKHGGEVRGVRALCLCRNW